MLGGTAAPRLTRFAIDPARSGRAGLATLTPERRLTAAALPRRGITFSCEVHGCPGDIVTRVLVPEAAPTGILGRGVLLDLPRAERRAELGSREAIGPERLDDAAERLGVTIECGDLLLVRTGALAKARRAGGWSEYRVGAHPGLSTSCAGWLARRGVAGVATDTPTVEVIAAGDDAPELPLRRAAHDAAGIALGIDFDLDPLAQACAEDGNYAFLLVMAPLGRPGVHATAPLAFK